MNEQATRYPLAWPVGWRRTPAHQRRRASFGTTKMVAPSLGTGRAPRQALTVFSAITRLAGELRRLGATGEILSTNVELRLDGLPRSGQAEPRDPGAAAYFMLRKKPMALACDKWDRVADNIAAIAQHIDALRRIERYGVGTLDQVFAGYLALPSGVRNWWDVLGVDAHTTMTEAEDAYRRLAKTAHPDAGGSHERMAELNAARDAAKKALA